MGPHRYGRYMGSAGPEGALGAVWAVTTTSRKSLYSERRCMVMVFYDLNRPTLPQALRSISYGSGISRALASTEKRYLVPTRQTFSALGGLFDRRLYRRFEADARDYAWRTLTLFFGAI
jgi:hypothetical protein